MGSDQRFSLKWNNYQTHLVTAFESLLGTVPYTAIVGTTVSVLNYYSECIRVRNLD
jgi:hypothetical protein